MLDWIVKSTTRFVRTHYFSLAVTLLASVHSGNQDLYAQLVITSPVNNQVQQRSTAGFASIAVTAYASFAYSRIEAHLIPIEGNTHQEAGWIFDEEQIRQGFLTASIQAETGWYQLKLMGYWEDNRIDSALVERVGVGEVFLVAGNSNAMGLPDLGAKDASDQVISFNATNKFLNIENITVAPDEPMQAPEFSPLRAKNNIFPSGETSWYWSELGDMLNKKLNSPILFLNAAWAAANSKNYRDAASGKDAFNIYVSKSWPNRQPYTNIVNTLRYFNSWLGIRAVLWSHGENDAQLNVAEDDYFNNIKTLIANSRRDSGYNVPWVIAKNSVSFSLEKPYLPVINAQNRLASLEGFNTFSGPDLDTIQIPRPAHGHFENTNGGIQGLTSAATAWNRSLSDLQFLLIPPLQPGYAVHTGVVPAGVFPGASFTLPYRINGQDNNATELQAELLDEDGKFIDTVGIGRKNPLTVKLPQNMENGRYRIRLSGANPVLAGSVSGLFHVNRANTAINFTHSISVRVTGQHIYVSWLMAANPALRKLVIQKTTDGENYTDLESFDAADNEINSHAYSYQDENTQEGSIFYRLRLELRNGETTYSATITVFQDGGPPGYVVFPNPVTRQQFYLRPDKPESNITCTLLDLNGREHPLSLTDQEVIGLLVVRPLYHLPVGNYILKIRTDSGVTVQRVLFF